MIREVNRKRLGVVVDRDVHGTAERGFDAGRRTPAAGEVVDHDFSLVRHERTSSSRLRGYPRKPRLSIVMSWLMAQSTSVPM